MTTASQRVAYEKWLVTKKPGVPTFFHCHWGPPELAHRLYPAYNHLTEVDEPFVFAIKHATPEDMLQFGWHRCQRWKQFPGKLILLNGEAAERKDTVMERWEAATLTGGRVEQAAARPNTIYLGPLLNCSQEAVCCSDPLSESCSTRATRMQVHVGIFLQGKGLMRRDSLEVKNTGERVTPTLWRDVCLSYRSYG